jgi:hypothetical protein
MDLRIVLAVIVVVAVVAAAVAWYVVRERRRAELRRQFGPEYERVVAEQGDAGRADRILSERQERVEQLHLRPLSAQDAARYRERWRVLQSRFVDDPHGAVEDADALIGEAMEARGYPVGDFEQRAADVSVEHPQVVADYREAHAIALRPLSGSATEDLRRAMVNFRALFSELVGGAEEREADVAEVEEDRTLEREEQRR